MINELEKQFFDTFGIEPKFGCKHLWNGGTIESVLTCSERCKNYCGRDKCEQFVVIYPQITDRILLELICIINQADLCLCGENDYFVAVNYKDLKEEVIAKCKRLADKNAFSEVTGEHIKHQVCRLFKENSNG